LLSKFDSDPMTNEEIIVILLKYLSEYANKIYSLFSLSNVTKITLSLNLEHLSPLELDLTILDLLDT